ncbi:hypothetical protein WJX84_007147 [Apatococcus fuscideae]|uniref:AAA+ ATPase domain-containing protein n=1 Tax=Apatococcus fuscideae TaxID=2026836 RepID=A0AAW1SWK9_9CHLO
MVATRRSHEQKPDLFSGTSSNSSGSGSSEEDLPFASKSEDEDPIVQPRKRRKGQAPQPPPKEAAEQAPRRSSRPKRKEEEPYVSSKRLQQRPDTNRRSSGSHAAGSKDAFRDETWERRTRLSARRASQAEPETLDTFSSDAEEHSRSDSDEGEPASRGSSHEEPGKEQAEVHQDGKGQALEAAEGAEERRYPLRVRTQQESLPLQPAGHARRQEGPRRGLASRRPSGLGKSQRRRQRSDDEIADVDPFAGYTALHQGAGWAGAGRSGSFMQPGSAMTPGGRAGGSFGLPGMAPGPCDGGLQPAPSQGKPISLGADKNAGNADICPVQVDPSVSFEQVGGLDKYIKSLKEMVFLPLVYPELFERFHVQPPRGVLFYGPPGTGKTLVARALAASASQAGQKVAFFMRKGADVLSKWAGEAERQLRLLFAEAQKAQPAIIFFDEIDGLAPARSSKTDQLHNSIVSLSLAQPIALTPWILLFAVLAGSIGS